MKKTFLIILLFPTLLFAHSPRKKNLPLLDYIAKGDKKNEVVILLHGFPQTNSMWSELQMALEKEDYYSLAPNLRGYSPNLRPIWKSKYKFNLMAADIIRLADKLKIKKFHIVGHDVGSAVAQFVASKFPDRVKSLTLLSTAHLNSVSYALRHDREQYEAFSYIRSFQTLFLPEFLLSRNDYSRLKEVWYASSPEMKDEYLRIFSQKGALTGAINAYRANFKDFKYGTFDLDKISTPTILIWGKKDHALLYASVKNNQDYFNGPYKEVFLDAGHWIIEEDFETTSNAIINHINNF